MSAKIFKGVPYTGTLPATLTGTKAGYLHRYKVYGNVGENLFNAQVGQGYYDTSNGNKATSPRYIRTDKVEVIGNQVYTVSYNCPKEGQTTQGRPDTFIYFWSRTGYIGYEQGVVKEMFTFTVPENAQYVAFVVGAGTGNELSTSDISDIMLTEGSTPPESYIPYEECGERTANLFDKDSAIPNKQYDRNGNLIDATEAGTWYASGLIEVEPNKTYVRSKVGETIGNVVNFYASDKTFQSRNTPGAGIPFTIPSTTKYISFAINADTNPIEQFMLTEGSTAPTSYIPYGYKLPLLSGSTPVDIYIGDDTLSTEEYVDSGTGKIYHMVSGVLTPTDPPVPFPQIPTSANSTTISWAGSELAPSEFDSIAEWVSATPKIYTNGAWTDTHTYTYDDGAWVADNSN